MASPLKCLNKSDGRISNKRLKIANRIFLDLVAIQEQSCGTFFEIAEWKAENSQIQISN